MMTTPKAKVTPPSPGNLRNTTPDSNVRGGTTEAVMLQQQDKIEDLKMKMGMLLSKLAEGEIFSPARTPKKIPKELEVLEDIIGCGDFREREQDQAMIDSAASRGVSAKDRASLTISGKKQTHEGCHERNLSRQVQADY
jgi:hypothetical protein